MDLQQAQDLFRQAIEAIGNNNFQEAITLFSQIKNTSDEFKKSYAASQFMLADLFKKLNRYEEAEQAYKNIKREYSVKTYVQAQWWLGIFLEKKGDLIGAAEVYNNVRREDSPYLHAWVQRRLWNLTQNKQHLKNIVLTDDVEIYAGARFLLGDLEKNLAAKHKYWQQIPQDTEEYKKQSRLINIIKRIANLESSTCNNKLFQIFQNIRAVLKALFVNNTYEQSIAHYTNLTVSKILLDVAQQKNSFLRLGTINFMNDPTEGCLLNEILKIDHNIKTDELAFISCFTLHHDSLNQFRLYSKEKQQEATGLSLIFSRNFFETNFNVFAMINKINPQVSKLEINEFKKEKEQKIGLYRCIYLDQNSGLIKVAQREEWSFHREYRQPNKASVLEQNPEAKQHWQEYQDDILDIELEVTNQLKQLVKQVQLLKPQQLNDEEKELLAEILLPLRYLIKHMAFKEEQECRMIYVTQMDNPLIQYDEKINRLYIDYEPSVMAHLEKIYLAPKAKDEKMVFEYLCSQGQKVRNGKAAVQVKISQNPFR